MAITKQKKAEILQNLGAKIKESQSVVFVNFHKLPVSDTNVLRNNLRKNNAGYVVAKKSLLARALADAGIDGEVPSLDGEVALAFSADQTASSKEVVDFGKTHKDNFKVLGGILEGRYIDAAQVAVIGKIPSREALYGQLLGVLNGPIRSFATVLDAIAKKKAE